MTKKWKSKKSKLLHFQKDLQILLEEYDYVMDCRLIFNQKGIVPQIVVDTPQKPVQPSQERLSPEQLTNKMKAGKFSVEDVKQKKQEQRPVPKSKDSKGKN
jgi:hypothetical protein